MRGGPWVGSLGKTQGRSAVDPQGLNGREAKAFKRISRVLEVMNLANTQRKGFTISIRILLPDTILLKDVMYRQSVCRVAVYRDKIPPRVPGLRTWRSLIHSMPSLTYNQQQGNRLESFQFILSPGVDLFKIPYPALQRVNEEMVMGPNLIERSGCTVSLRAEVERASTSSSELLVSLSWSQIDWTLSGVGLTCSGCPYDRGCTKDLAHRFILEPVDTIAKIRRSFHGP